MGRLPCCDKVGIKKGPWTPEEDIILMSYIQEHGPGNWRTVPINTGLMRCSKSCRLRWTNYLRPGIKRGGFTPHEEAVIVHLQSLLGNKWAAIASHLPRRTDNDIKNFWNTHLKKKLRKQQAMGAIFAQPSSSSAGSTVDPTGAGRLGHMVAAASSSKIDGCDVVARATCSNPEVSQMITRRRSPFAAAADFSSSSYASSMDNISKLLDGIMKSSTPQNTAADVSSTLCCPSTACLAPAPSWPSPTYVQQQQHQPALMGGVSYDGTKQQQQAPLCSIEKWLLEEATEQAADLMELSDGCSSVPMLF